MCKPIFSPKVVQERKISTKINYDVLKNLTMGGSSGGLINGSEKQGVSSNGNSTSSVLSPKNEPNANTEKVHNPIIEGKQLESSF